jgi:DNA-binding MarR family transcriptional regulator
LTNALFNVTLITGTAIPFHSLAGTAHSNSPLQRTHQNAVAGGVLTSSWRCYLLLDSGHTPQVSKTERFETALWTIARRMGSELTSHTDLKLTGQQFITLHFISKNGPCKVTDLAERMEVKPSAITVMIDRLIAQEVVRRRHDDKDRRVVLIDMTDRGREVLQQLQHLRRQIIGNYLNELDPAKLDIFLDIFEQIAGKIPRSTAPPTSTGDF